MSEARKLAAVLVADVAGYSRLTIGAKSSGNTKMGMAEPRVSWALRCPKPCLNPRLKL